MKTVAVHADDFGMSEGTNLAIAQLLDRGAIQSTSIMANGEAFRDAARRAVDGNENWSVGLHANLTQGLPCGTSEGLESILDDSGRFAGRRALWRAVRRGAINHEALVREITAQWNACIESGVRPTHIDSHQHAHLIPGVQAAAWSVARSNAVAVRVLRLSPGFGSLARRSKSLALNWMARRGERRAGLDVSARIELLSTFQGNGPPSVTGYRALLEASDSEFVELMVHPAIVDRQHRQQTGISKVSDADYIALNSQEWLDFIAGSSNEFVSTCRLLEAAGIR